MKRAGAPLTKTSPSDLDKKESDGRDPPQGVAPHAHRGEVGAHEPMEIIIEITIHFPWKSIEITIVCCKIRYVLFDCIRYCCLLHIVMCTLYLLRDLNCSRLNIQSNPDRTNPGYDEDVEISLCRALQSYLLDNPTAVWKNVIRSKSCIF